MYDVVLACCRWLESTSWGVAIRTSSWMYPVVLWLHFIGLSMWLGATLSVDLRLMESSVATASENSESVTITLRIDPRMLARIKRLARSRYLNYQSMIKQWLSERMEQEMRER